MGQVLANPYVWHFAMHAIPALPERLVQGRQAAYFDYFYDVLSPEPERITAQAREEYVRAYATDAALSAGFDWYRAFPADAAAHVEAAARPVATPMLYLRGEKESGDIAGYVDGFRAAGLSNLDYALIPDAGHFSPGDAPAQVWQQVARFAGV